MSLKKFSNELLPLTIERKKVYVTHRIVKSTGTILLSLLLLFEKNQLPAGRNLGTGNGVDITHG